MIFLLLSGQLPDKRLPVNIQNIVDTYGNIGSIDAINMYGPGGGFLYGSELILA